MATNASPSSSPSPSQPSSNLAKISVPDSQSTQVPTSPSSHAEQELGDQQPTQSTPMKSLFGPFPPSENLSQSDQQIPGAIEAKTVSTSPPPDRVDFTNANRQAPDSSTLDFNPQVQEPTKIPQTTHPSHSNNASFPPLIREKTAPAIGPATDKPNPEPNESDVEGPVLFITLLLSSTGARHPYKLDEKYLKKRNVVVEGNNPINISLYKLKELILRDWREEWEVKPSSPESIRLISMGKLLNDKACLSDSGFTNGTTPHIIHMTIKPQEIVDEEDAKMKATGSGRGDNERSPGCRCIVQ